MTARRLLSNRRTAALGCLLLAGGAWWLAGDRAAASGVSMATACGATPCAVEPQERVEPARAPAPERPLTPSAPSLDWRSLLPAGFLRPR
jgi:hypothetical protein